ncbi:MAG TPA: hypothetical protein PLA31_11155, partial [Clostridia bacterium]|nr:hypothetical protein [Clostridia bacterium]
YTDSNLYCIVAPGLLSPCCVSQPRRGFSYAIGFLPCRPTKSLAALDANRLYISIKQKTGSQTRLPAAIEQERSYSASGLLFCS